MTPRRKQALALSAVLLVVSTLASVGSAASLAKKQRIAIEEKGGQRGGTFTLVPLTPGPLKADSGTWVFTGATQLPTIVRNGQRVTRYRGGDAFKGKRGAFSLPVTSDVVDAGGGYEVGTQTWSFRSGTGAYAGVDGGGAGAFVATPTGNRGDRFQGWVRRR